MNEDQNEKIEAQVLEPEVQDKELISGEFLKKTRQGKNMSLAEISKATRIGAHYLQAIEDEDLSAFPARVYLKGFLRQYAKHLGLDPEVITTGYLRHKKN